MDLSNKKLDFPILNKKIDGNTLIYFDNAATSQVPSCVIDEVANYDQSFRANVHRGIHSLSEKSTTLYEDARSTISKFINATIPKEIVFVKNTTEGLNLIAYAWGRKNIQKDDIILISEAEHHSNHIPWQVLANEKEAEIRYIPVNDKGFIDIKAVDVDWGKVKLVAIAHVSNVLGMVNDTKEISKYIKRRVEEVGANMPRIVVDGAQAAPHFEVNVQKLGCDFYAFSGHKMCGPMGIGVVWCNRDVFDELQPFMTGGGMISSVAYTKFTPGMMPDFLEAGTPNVSGAVGLAKAVKYLQSIGLNEIDKYEKELVKYALKKFDEYGKAEIYGSTNYIDKTGVISFNIEGISAHDLSTVINSKGIAIRSGHHCVMPWHEKNNISASARMSLYFYNSYDEIDSLFDSFVYAESILLSKNNE